MFTFDEHVSARPRINSGQLAERTIDRSVVVEDLHTVDAGAHDLEAFEVTVALATATDVEADVVNKEAVTSRVDATILLVFPLEGVLTGSNIMREGFPSGVCTVVHHADAVDVEAALVPIIGVG